MLAEIFDSAHLFLVQRQSKRTKNMLMNNRISELPDDILTYVLSYIPIIDAGKTSVLSKRWKYVWAYIPTLIFDSCNNFYLVNQVISLHKAPILDKFRVRFDVTSNGNSEDVVDNWLRFAMEKKVKRFKLKLNFLEYYGTLPQSCYTFPQSSPCNSLISLKLGYVNVTGEILESFLRNCLALECLSVKNSRSLVELTVGGPLLKLKSLIIARCYFMKKLEICAPNLVSACYIGPNIDMQFKSTPKLAQVSFGSVHANNLIHLFSNLSSYLSQIEVLTLSPTALVENIILPIEDLVFPRLRKLDVTVFASANEKLFLLVIFLMKACPFLLHFRLQFQAGLNNLYYSVESGVRRWTPCPHYHLKTLEIAGFNGEAIQIEIAVLLINAAVVLDKITVEPGKNRHWGGVQVMRMKRGEEIRPHIKPGTKLEIL